MAVTLDFFSDSLPTVPICLAVGNFDGVHYAHQALIRHLVDQAKESNSASAILTFAPHPALLYPRYTSHRTDFFLLQTIKEKNAAIMELGIDFLIHIRFDRAFSLLSAVEFTNLLTKKLSLKRLLLGYNFRFGKNRTADVSELQALLAPYNIAVEVFSAVQKNGIFLSSSELRKALFHGEVQAYRAATGRFFALSGLVVKGDQRGRIIGFPTANIKVRPNGLAVGVYAVLVHFPHQSLLAVANLGYAPTMRQTLEKRLEVHIPNFNIDLYHQHLRVEFIQKIRDEQAFAHVEELKLAIQKDIQTLFMLSLKG